MEQIKVGMKAPDFTLDNAQGDSVTLSDFAGKKVLLSWHPLAWTGVCTDQMRSLEVNYEKFEELNTVAFGLSVDSVPCKKAWAAVLRLKNIDILCDFWPQGQVAQEYGLFREELGSSQRANVIVDGQGIVRWVKVYPVSELPDIEEVLAVLAEM